jgi:hypothetical protein
MDEEALLNTELNGYSEIDKRTNKKLDEALYNADIKFVRNDDKTYSVKYDSLTTAEINKILEEDLVARGIYSNFGIVDIDAHQKYFIQEYDNLVQYGLNGKPYEVSDDASSKFMMVNLLDPAASAYIAKQDNVIVNQTYINEQKVEMELRSHFLTEIIRTSALKDINKFVESIKERISWNESLMPEELNVLSELMAYGYINLDMTKSIVDDCYSLLKALNNKIQENEDLGWFRRTGKDLARYEMAVVDLFWHGYWSVEPKYHIDGQMCMQIIALASKTYGIDGVDIDNKKDWTYFQETENLMRQLNMDFSGDAPGKPWLEAIRDEYNTKYKTEFGPELFQDSVYSYKPEHYENINLSLVKSMNHPNTEKHSKFKVIQLLRNFSERGDDVASLAISSLGEISEKEVIDYLMELAYYDPHALEPTKFEVVPLTYFEDRATEEAQAQALLSLAAMYTSMNEANQPVIKEYIGSFLHGVAQNKSNSLALGLELPYPNHGIYKTITDVVGAAYVLAWSTMIPAKTPVKTPTFTKFGNVYKLEKSAVMYYEGNAFSMVATGVSPLRATRSIPFVTSATWQIPTAVINSEKLMNSVFTMTRVIGTTGALINTDAGTFFIDTKTNQILTEADAKAKTKNIEAIKNNPVFIEISTGTESYQYVIGVNGITHFEDIIEHLRLLSIANPNVRIKITDKNNRNINPNNPVNFNKPIEVPSQTLNKISTLLQDVGVSPAMEAEIINAFKNGLSFASPRIAESFMGGNTIATSVEVVTTANGTIVLNIIRTLANGSELVDYYRTFTRSADGRVSENARVITHPALAGAKTDVLPLTIPYAGELDAAIANYNNFCKDITPKL